VIGARCRKLVLWACAVLLAAGCQSQEPGQQAPKSERIQGLEYNCGRSDGDLVTRQSKVWELAVTNAITASLAHPASLYGMGVREAIRDEYYKYDKLAVSANLARQIGDSRRLSLILGEVRQTLIPRALKIDASFLATKKPSEPYSLGSLYRKAEIHLAYALHLLKASNLRQRSKDRVDYIPRVVVDDDFFDTLIRGPTDSLTLEGLAYILFRDRRFEEAYATRYSVISNVASVYTEASIAPLSIHAIFERARLNDSSQKSRFPFASDRQALKGQTCNLLVAVTARWIVLANEVAAYEGDSNIRAESREQAKTLIQDVPDVRQSIEFSELQRVAGSRAGGYP
jgi:hypothetical protein